MKIEEQDKVLENDKKRMLVSASAGSGKTYVMIKYITQLICKQKVSVNDLLVLTFTKAAATEMKERLQKRLKEQGNDAFIVEQLDNLSVANISTIHSFCEKCLKKYANLLNINVNFEIIDENLNQKIKNEAFEKAFKELYENNQEVYELLISSFKNSKSNIAEIMFEIESLVNSVADKEGFISENLKNNGAFFEKAEKFLFENIKDNLKSNLNIVEKTHVDEFELRLKNNLKAILQSSDLKEMAYNCENFSFPELPRKKLVGDDVVQKLSVIKTEIVKEIAKIKDLNLTNEDIYQFQKIGKLEKVLLELFLRYEKVSMDIKKSKNYLDFYDLEKFMKTLSEKEDLFSGIKYVFVDEYQDTNKVQEKIIKNIAKNSNFVAVGDVKQGIYGFRLASSEIFLKDLQNFSEEENSVVHHLKSNFRSSQKVLDFINNIFKVCMTKEVSGVDYYPKSMLHGMADFVDDGKKAVYIDILTPQKKVEIPLPDIYSVKNAKVFQDEGNFKLLLDIKRRINEVLGSKIFDNGEFRQCRFSDIAILSRNRNSFFNQLEKYLQESEVPVISNNRNSLMSEPEILILINLLKLALNFNDDLALMSVMTSGLFGFSYDEMAEMRSKKEVSLCNFVEKSENVKIIDFKEKMEKFRKNSHIFGIYKAFLDIFVQTNYRAYINLLPNAMQINLFVDKFLQEIVGSGYEFDLAGLIKYFENVDIVVSPDASVEEDAVLLTTIHNSKGLEYPIVFLINCDKSLSQSKPKINVEINEDFGLAVKYFDLENNNEIITVKMRAIKESKAEKEFAEELMIFYVALTRAKNRIYIFGEKNSSMFDRITVRDCDCYFDLIFYALKEEKQLIQRHGKFENSDLEICLIEEIEEEKIERIEQIENGQIDNKITQKIEKYLNFKYRIDDNLNFRLKESVTVLNTKNKEDELGKYSNESFTFSTDLVETGNAYHLALKTLDFEKISSFEELKSQIGEHKDVLDSVINLLDLNVLLNNILILKKIASGGKVFKEKEFIMKDKINNFLSDAKLEDEILVQGVIDLFVIKDNNGILVDYKYSNSNNEQYLIEKYKNQLKLYKMAIKNALNIDVNQIYLLSLKNNKLITVNL